jgi:HAD superfamily hydrolase (TIGR01484 family)
MGKGMRYLALASDYDGTLAHDGRVTTQTLKSLERFRHSGRHLILVTGRELPELEDVFPELGLFELIVAENGGLLYRPESREKRALTSAPPPEFIADLKRRGVADMSVGETIVATWQPFEAQVLASIRDLGLDLQVIFNKEAVMVLPSGVNKMTGLDHALDELRLSRHNIVGVGDAENDHPFLSCCEFSVAVANAIPALKDRVDWVTAGERGAGVEELIAEVLANDLAARPFREEKRRSVLLGRSSEQETLLPAQGRNMLLCGQSGGGKSTFVAGIVERLLSSGYQLCLIDPEGDYEGFPGLFNAGDEQHAPSPDEILRILETPRSSLVVNLLALKMHDRPHYFAGLLTRLQESALRTGRPHWIVIDEAHHLLPSEWAPASGEVAGHNASLLLVTVHPEHVSPAALNLVDVVAVVGKEPSIAVQEFARTRGITPPAAPAGDLPAGDAWLWFLDENRGISIKTEPCKAERKRHRRRYAEGELEPERVFYFRGPEGKLNLRSQNLATFVQLSEGVDDDTWLFHL